jgi:selenocysteine-specific elongation factor
MIIGTAGHIDHGKTSLVKALTGTNADRLPEEKARGITIELGFAYAQSRSGDMIGFVDVPGHEKFVHTMAAGAAGMDHGLLVIAADDGIMPQTREHLRILDLLNIPAITIALTKVDLVEPEQVVRIQRQIAEELSVTRFAQAPVFIVSSQSGEGVQDLHQYLFRLASLARTHGAAYFRLPIDRVFVVKGMGVAVTGAVIAGHVKVGDTLVLSRTGQAVKVRSIHAQNTPTVEAGIGSRCGIVLTGLELGAVARGDWLLAPELKTLTPRIDCQLTMPADSSRSLKDGELVLLHHGTTHVSARLILLDANEVMPGQQVLAQCVLSHGLPFCWSDRLILRDGSARHTLAGAKVLDTAPPVRGRKKSDRLLELKALAATESIDAIASLLLRSKHPLNLTHWATATNQSLETLIGRLSPPLAEHHVVAGQTYGWTARNLIDLSDAVLQCLGRLHVNEPDEPGLGIERLRRMSCPLMSTDVFRAWLHSKIQQGLFSVTGSDVHLPEHRVVLSQAEQALWEKVLPIMLDAGFEGLWVRDLALFMHEAEDRVRVLLRKQARQSLLIQIVKDLFYPFATMHRIADVMRDIVEKKGAVSVIDFRDQLGIGRKRSIQLLEAFDRIGFSRRLIVLVKHSKTIERDQRIIRNAELFH